MIATLVAGGRRIVQPVGRPLRRAAIGVRTRAWPAHSRLFVAGDGHRWAISDDVNQINRVARTLGVHVGHETWVAGVRNQSLFYASHYGLFGSGWGRGDNRIGVAYLHGRPGTPGMPDHDECYDELRRRHTEIDRVQVTCRSMEELVLSTGIAPEKVFLIPIGIELERFPLRDASSRAAARSALDLPESAFVVGSFQKDSVGWGEGTDAKSIKGPDVLLGALAVLRRRVPELFVLLTGPARGYVKSGLAHLGIPYKHFLPSSRDEMATTYHALDVYIVSSRDEGGPKAVLEAMASGVPLVTTRVGQAADLVRHEENGYMVEIEDAEGLARFAGQVASASAADVERVVRTGRETAEENSYEALLPRWRALLSGFVEIEGR